MFRKVELWFVLLLCALFMVILVGYGAFLKYELGGGERFPLIRKTVLFIAKIPWNLQKLTTDEFHTPNNRHAEKPRFKRFLNTDRNELLLLARYDGDNKRGLVEIVDLSDFSVLHTYRPNIDEINSKTDMLGRIEFRNLLLNATLSRYLIEHPLINDNGELLFSYSSPLVKIDFCGNLLWVNDADSFHHSRTIDHEKNYWTPTVIFPHTIDEELVGVDYGENEYSDMGITKISPDGKILYNKSVTQIFLDNDYKYLIFGQWIESFNDTIHLNDIQPVLKDGLYWKKGDVFLSMRNLSMIMLFRPSTNKIINVINGPFFKQHDVDIISDKEISMYNNNVLNTFNGERILSNNEVVIYNFETQQFSKKFENGMKKNKVSTLTGGSHEILKDGSMIVEEQDDGRILFFNSNGELEWEYTNKAKNEKAYVLSRSTIIEDESLIANIKEKVKNTKCTN